MEYPAIARDCDNLGRVRRYPDELSLLATIPGRYAITPANLSLLATNSAGYPRIQANVSRLHSRSEAVGFTAEIAGTAEKEAARPS